MSAPGFVPPTYPFDKLGFLYELAGRHPGGVVDLSIGTPCDPPPPEVVSALSTSSAERGYPSSAGSQQLREAASGWMERRLGVSVPPSAVAACVGTKELVASLPSYLRLRSPDRDSVLYPAVSYPTYEMGARLAGLRSVALPPGADGRLDLSCVSEADAERSLCLFVNSPGNPAGQLEDLGAAAAWGRRHGVPVFSDECYVELTWEGPRRTILEHGRESVVAVHSLSKRSNLAGLRVGFIAGDDELVDYLSAVRRHAGLMVAGPVQHAAALALGDDSHVDRQAEIYLERLSYLAGVLNDCELPTELPQGGFYLFPEVPAALGVASASESPAFFLAGVLARAGGLVVSPGDAYGPLATSRVRIALVQPIERLRLVGKRLASRPLASYLSPGEGSGS